MRLQCHGHLVYLLWSLGRLDNTGVLLFVVFVCGIACSYSSTSLLFSLVLYTIAESYHC